ncbi:MAG TPA: tetratricopeptide repeat protein [Polyangiales bacterium]|nr:tetratricopeptide repeat protein [Polyangiales bacterium]
MYDAQVLVLGYAAVGFTLIGALVYLLVVKLRAFEPEPEAELGAPEGVIVRPPAPTLAELTSEVEVSPSFHNRVRIGWALLHAEQPARAQGYFEQALATHRTDKQALYGLGLSQLEQGAVTDAANTLSRLVERSFAYEDYEAAVALAEAYVRTDQHELAAELLLQVAQESGRLEHQVALARHHVRLAQRTEAQDVLRSALRQFDTLPAFLRQRNGAAATEARRLLRMLEQ